jgi:hypothetical protein
VGCAIASRAALATRPGSIAGAGAGINPARRRSPSRAASTIASNSHTSACPRANSASVSAAGVAAFPRTGVDEPVPAGGKATPVVGVGGGAAVVFRVEAGPDGSAGADAGVAAAGVRTGAGGLPKTGRAPLPAGSIAMGFPNRSY